MPGRRPAPAKTAAATQPVARVAVDIGLPHLDRPFDYLVTEGQSAGAQPGRRVRVRFAGQLVDGFVLDRVDASEHTGRLAYLERVVSPEPVLSAPVAELARAVADRWAGTFADVVRLAVPPRHAAVENAAVENAAVENAEPVEGAGSVDKAESRADPGGAPRPSAGPDDLLGRYAGGPALLHRLVAGESPRAVWAVAPGDWPAEVAAAVAATRASGRGAIVVVPDHRDVVRVDAALTRELGPGRHVALSADLGPAERYRCFLALSRGRVGCVVGTRSAVWAPVDPLGLLVVWDDGDDLLAEPRAPYCHARDVAVLRAHLCGAGLLLAGHAVTTEGASLTASGWAVALDATAAAREGGLPRVRAAGEDEELDRDPAARAARAALDGGAPVLVQVPRRGYQPALACARCRAPARCPACAGPLGRPAGDRPPACRWCGAPAAAWRCAVCGGDALRAVVVGTSRTAEELGRAFPGVAVRTSTAGAVVDRVPARPAVVVATPGAEPTADGGYGAALLLDAWSVLARPDLRAGEEALRRWLAAAALVRGAAAGGRVVVVAPGQLRPVQALLRWQPRWHADRELDDRGALHLPPAARMAALTGPAAAVRELVELAILPAAAELLGPVPQPVREGDAAAERLLVRVPRRDGGALAAALKQAAGVRSARKSPDAVRIEMDPLRLT